MQIRFGRVVLGGLVAGLVIKELGHVPLQAERMEYRGLEFEVTEGLGWIAGELMVEDPVSGPYLDALAAAYGFLS